MLDMPGLGSFLLIQTQYGSGHVKPCGSNWVKIQRAQLKMDLNSPVVH